MEMKNNNEIKNENEINKEIQKAIKDYFKGKTKLERKIKTKEEILDMLKIGNSSSMPMLRDALINLVSKEFDLKEVFNGNEVYMLLGTNGFFEAIAKANDRFNKWYDKVGKNFSEIAQMKFKGAMLLYALMDRVLNPILNDFGITATLRAMYRSFSFKLLKCLTQKEPSGWAMVVSQKLKEWETREELDKDLLKIIAHITLKTYAYYLKNV
jgi:hypothetical protein